MPLVFPCNWWDSKYNCSEFYQSKLPSHILAQNLNDLTKINISNHENYLPSTRTVTWIYNACNSPYTRYYIRLRGEATTSVTANMQFTADANNLGNAQNNPVPVSLNAAGSSTVTCHTLTRTVPADYRENESNDNFTNTLNGFAAGYKSTYFKVSQNNTQKMDINFKLTHNLDSAQNLRYRILKLSASGANVVHELASNVSTDIANSSITLSCLEKGDYLVQVISKINCVGTTTLFTSAQNSPNLALCTDDFCAPNGVWTWTNQKGDRKWDEPTNWNPASVPDIRKNVIIPAGLATPIIEGTVWAANITIGSGLEFQENGKLILNRDWTNNSLQTVFDGKITFAGCIKQHIKGNSSTFQNVEVDNSNHVQLDVNTQIRQHLDLKAGNLISNGKLTLLSNANETAMVSQHDGITISGKFISATKVIGDVTVQRHITGHSSGFKGVGYHYVSSQVQDATVGQWESVNELNPMYIYNDYYWYRNDRIEFTTLTYFPNLFYYDAETSKFDLGGTSAYLPNGDFDWNFNTKGFEGGKNPNGTIQGGWKCPASKDAFLERCKGYSLHIKQGKTLDLTGELNNGNISVNIHRDIDPNSAYKGWNLIGNPYPAPLNAYKFWTDNSSKIAPVIYRRIPLGERNNVTWDTYMPAIMDGVSANPQNYPNPQIGNNLIASGQGFFVIALNNGKNTLNFNNLQRESVYINPTAYRTEETKTGMLKFALQNGEWRDEAIVYFDEQNSSDFDVTEDAFKKIENNSRVPNLSMKTDKGLPLSINGLPTIDSYLEVPLTFKIPFDTLHTFRILNKSLFDEDIQISLYDKSDTSKYVFMNDSSITPAFLLKKGEIKDRFVLVFERKPKSQGSYNSLFVYPNPSSEYVFVDVFGFIAKNYQIKIMDLLGRTFSDEYFYKSTYTQKKYEVQHYPVGVYLVQVSCEGKSYTGRFVKQ